MSIGVSSSFFVYDMVSKRFIIPERPDLRLIATNRQSIRSILRHFAAMGTNFARLEHQVNSYALSNLAEYSIEPFAYFLASLARISGCCVFESEEFREDNLTASAINLPPANDLISRLYETIICLELSCPNYGTKEDILREILVTFFSRASKPFINLLSTLVGLNCKDSDETNSQIAFFSDLDTALLQIKDSTPSFILQNLVESASHSGHCLQLLRKCSPQHPLLISDLRNNFHLTISIKQADAKLYRSFIAKHMKLYVRDIIDRETRLKAFHGRKVSERQSELIRLQENRKLALQSYKPTSNSKANGAKKMRWKLQVDSFLVDLAAYREHQELQRIEEEAKILRNQAEQEEIQRAREVEIRVAIEAEYSIKMKDLELKSMKADWKIKRGNLVDQRHNILKDQEFFTELSVENETDFDLAHQEEVFADLESEIAGNTVTLFEELSRKEEIKTITQTEAEETMVALTLDQLNALEDNEAKASKIQTETKAEVKDNLLLVDQIDNATPFSNIVFEENASSDILRPTSEKVNSSTDKSLCSCHGIVEYLCPIPSLKLAQLTQNTELLEGSSLDILLEMTLYKAVNIRCDLISRETLLVFIRDLKLQNELVMVGKGFFLQDFDFTDYVIAHISKTGSFVKEPSILNDVYTRFKLADAVKLIIPNCSITLIYSPPPFLNYILDSDALKKFELFFAVFLRTRYCLAALNNFDLSALHRSIKISCLRFRMYSLEFVSSIYRYFQEIALEPWQKFIEYLSVFEKSALYGYDTKGGRTNELKYNSQLKITDLKSLKYFQGKALDEICWRMLLSKEHKPIFTILMEIFDEICAICETMKISGVFDSANLQIQKRIEVFVKVIVKMKHLETAENGIHESDCFYSLLTLINFSKFYSKDD
ncbi:hypothetical protein HK100_012320 [Physocladia obscura]|uniref:Gamma tubulin complex component C-terminal domain-containing protein n=1 Tax=Physocladia obscura TaxID=109957 RepID=A0AAD5T8A8_9FUNG|nr:hypothetical protein HK100_012320 [Physocladia obscura]